MTAVFRERSWNPEILSGAGCSVVGEADMVAGFRETERVI